MVGSLSILLAMITTIENNPKRAGVLLTIALSDHWRCVSIPRCALNSSKVTSMFQRSICNPPASRFVRKKASVCNLPSGLRTTIYLMGTGVLPGVYQREMPENISSDLLIPSYQRISMGVQLVFRSSTRFFNEDCFLPFLGLGPGLPG